MCLPVGETESVLVTGPVLSGRRRLVHRTLHERSEMPVMVSTREPAESARSMHRRVAASSAEDTAASEVAGCSVVVGIDAGAHDEQTIEQFVPIFEMVAETQRTDDGDQGCRVRYPTPTDWQAL